VIRRKRKVSYFDKDLNEEILSELKVLYLIERFRIKLSNDNLRKEDLLVLFLLLVYKDNWS